MHPKAFEAQMKREIRSVEKIQLIYAKQERGVHFLTVNDYTICYRVQRRDVVELSTSLKHPFDRPDRHTGQLEAFARFAAGEKIQVKRPNYMSVKEFLQRMFS
jgi:hypothetical protein